MKRNLFGVFASLVVAGTLVAAQDSPSPASSAPAPQSPAAQAPAPPSPAAQGAQPAQEASANDTTLTGCLLQGSGPSMYILDNAKAENAAKNAKGQRYTLEIAAPAEQIKPVLNSHVRVIGSPEPNDATAAGASAAVASDQKASDSTLQKISVKRITRLSETCPATK